MRVYLLAAATLLWATGCGEDGAKDETGDTTTTTSTGTTGTGTGRRGQQQRARAGEARRGLL